MILIVKMNVLPTIDGPVKQYETIKGAEQEIMQTNNQDSISKIDSQTNQLLNLPSHPVITKNFPQVDSNQAPPSSGRVPATPPFLKDRIAVTRETDDAMRLDEILEDDIDVAIEGNHDMEKNRSSGLLESSNEKKSIENIENHSYLENIAHVQSNLSSNSNIMGSSGINEDHENKDVGILSDGEEGTNNREFQIGMEVGKVEIVDRGEVDEVTINNAERIGEERATPDAVDIFEVNVLFMIKPENYLLKEMFPSNSVCIFKIPLLIADYFDNTGKNGNKIANFIGSYSIAI